MRLGSRWQVTTAFFPGGLRTPLVLIALACRGLCGRETADTAELGKINFVISYGHGGNVGNHNLNHSLSGAPGRWREEWQWTQERVPPRDNEPDSHVRRL